MVHSSGKSKEAANLAAKAEAVPRATAVAETDRVEKVGVATAVAAWEAVAKEAAGMAVAAGAMAVAAMVARDNQGTHMDARRRRSCGRQRPGCRHAQSSAYRWTRCW